MGFRSGQGYIPSMHPVHFIHSILALACLLIIGSGRVGSVRLDLARLDLAGLGFDAFLLRSFSLIQTLSLLCQL